MGTFYCQKQDESKQKRPPWQEAVFIVVDKLGRLSPTGRRFGSKKEIYPSHPDKTNTKSTTETTTEITTTAQARDVVAKATEIFAPLGLSKKDVSAIAKASGYDLDRCMAAKAVYDAQRNPIGNATGWLIAAVGKSYTLSSRIPPARNPFNNFSQQIYTADVIDSLEEELLSAHSD